MASKFIAKFDCSGQDSNYVILEATPKGTKPLDLKLVASDGEGIFAATLKHDRVSTLLAGNSAVSNEEWQVVLESVLKQEPMQDIITTAAIQQETSLTITVRKQIQGMSQRLGAITLSYDMSKELQVLDWCATSATAVAETKDTLSKSRAKVEELEASVAELRKLLDELVQSKQVDETAMLHKFRDLLNEKKVKIREQQKILNSGALTTVKSSSPQPDPPSPVPAGKARKPAQSRLSKRKAAKKPAESSSEDDGFEGMDVDQVKQEPVDDDSDLDRATTASDSSGESPEIMSAQPRSTAPTGGTQDMKIQNQTKAKPPPPRALPFTNKRSTAGASSSNAPAKAAAKSESETESDDNEL